MCTTDYDSLIELIGENAFVLLGAPLSPRVGHSCVTLRLRDNADLANVWENANQSGSSASSTCQQPNAGATTSRPSS